MAAAGVEVARAYVTLVPKFEGVQGAIAKELGGSTVGSAGESAGKTIGGRIASGIGTALKVTGGLLAATGAATVGLVTAVSKSFSELEQNLGGSEAVFGAYAKNVQAIGQQAYKNLGLSTSDYLATVNKMGALFQGSGLEQEKAMDLSTRAMQRAADMASVMGIDMSVAMESVAGAAKGNFTMMDNLGVAMNATTIQAYALEKGINFDWNTASQAEKSELAMQMFFDSTEQYAGNFAREAEQTLSGSIGMLQASVQSFVAGLGDADADMAQLTANVADSLSAVITNIVPVVENIAAALPGVIAAVVEQVGVLLPQLLPVVTDLVGTVGDVLVGLIGSVVAALPGFIADLLPAALGIVEALLNSLPLLVSAAAEVVAALAVGLAEALPTLVPAAVSAVVWIVGALADSLPMLLDAALALIQGLADGLLAAAPQLVDSLPEVVLRIVDFLVAAVPQIVEAGIALVGGLVEAIPTVVDELSRAVPSIVTGITDGLATMLPAMIDGALTLLMAIADAIPVIVPVIVDALPGLVDSIVGGLRKNLKTLIAGAVQLFRGLVDAIPKIVPEIVKAVPGLVKTIVGVLVGLIPDLVGAGKDLVFGLVGGLVGSIPDVVAAVWSLATGLLDAILGFFGIHSPSTVFAELGGNLVAGLLSGLQAAWGAVAGWFSTVWEGIKTVVLGVWDAIRFGIGTAWDWIRDHVFTPIKSGVDLVRGAFDTARTGITGAWASVKTSLGSAWDWIRDHVFDKIKAGVAAVRTAFETAQTGIDTAWDAVKEIVAAPVRFVVNTVYNDGIRKWWNAIAGKIAPSTKLDELTLGFARGTEDHRAQIARAGTWRLWAEPETGGEAYIPLASSKRARSTQILAQVADRFGYRLSTFAGGGVLGWVSDRASDAKEVASTVAAVLKDPAKAIREGIDKIADAAWGAFGGDGSGWLDNVKRFPGELASTIIDKVKGIVGLADEETVLGAAGPAGSGLLSGIGVAVQTAALRALDPTARVTSGLRPGAVTAVGTKSYHGRGRAIDIVSPNMGATFDKIRAVYGARSPELFYTPRGMLLYGRPYNAAAVTRAMHYDHVHWAFGRGGIVGAVYDQGGWMPPGTAGVNLSGRPEAVLSPDESAALKAGLAGRRMDPRDVALLSKMVAAACADVAVGLQRGVEGHGMSAANRDLLRAVV